MMREILSRTVITLIGIGLLAAAGQAQTAVRRDLVRNPSEAVLTDVSAGTGDVTRELEHSSRGFRAVRFGEHGDRPCYADILPWGSAQFRDRALEDSQCTNRINTTQYWEVMLPEDADVIGLEACVNRRSGRLKGLRLHHNGGEFGGVVSEVQPNCRGNRGRWGDRVDCPANYRGTGLRLHYRQQPRGQNNWIIGMQLICRPM